MLGLSALILACSPQAPQPDNAAAPAAAASAEEKPAAKNAATSSAAAPDLTFEPDGLRLVTNASGPPLALPFGTPREQLLKRLEGFRGPADTGTLKECGAGPMDYASWADGLTLHFQDGRLAGWALDQRAGGGHSTSKGVGPGSTRAELQAGYDVEVEETSIGTEFIAGAMGGVLSGPGRDAKVLHMWAGTTCIMR